MVMKTQMVAGVLVAMGAMGAMGAMFVGCREQVEQPEQSGVTPAEVKPTDEAPPVERPEAPEKAVGYETIDEAIARGDLEDMKRQIAADAAKIQKGKNPGMSPLLQAVLRSKDEIAVVLLEAGADPNAQDQSQRTALHLAVERGNAAIVPTLVKHKADPNLLDRGVDPTVVSKTGVTALDVAKEMKNEAALKILGAL